MKRSTKRKTIDEFVYESNIIHKNLYNYDNVIYTNNKIKVNITCKLHGDFSQRPHDHLKGNGCPVCKGTYKFSNSEIIKKCVEVHGDTYDYSLVNYTGYDDKIEIVCKKHGSFYQQAYNHYQLHQGCPQCTKTGYNRSKDGYFYIQEIIFDNKLISYKFGITNKTPEERKYRQSSNSIFDHNIIFSYNNCGQVIYDLEMKIKTNINGKYIKQDEMKDGFTETINPNDYENMMELITEFINELPKNI